MASKLLRRYSQLLLLGAALALFVWLRKRWPGLNLSFVQLLVFPLMIIFFWRLRLFSVRLPRILVLAAALAALAAFAMPYLQPGRAPALLVSTLAGDDFENQSRIFWQELDQALRGRGSAAAARFYGSFSSEVGAAEVLRTYPRSLGLIWGSRQWINVSLPDVPTRTLHQLGAGAAEESIFRLELVSNVPIFGSSYEPHLDTARFMAAFAAGAENLRDKSGDEWEEGETELRYAGEYGAWWAANAHRGVPWFLIGNLRLQRALEGGGYRTALLDCAEEAYFVAAYNLVPENNPELYAAIHNNLGVLLYLRGYVEGKPALLKQARYKFKYAVDLAELKNPFRLRYRAPDTAARNLDLIRESRAARIQPGGQDAAND